MSCTEIVDLFPSILISLCVSTWKFIAAVTLDMHFLPSPSKLKSRGEFQNSSYKPSSLLGPYGFSGRSATMWRSGTSPHGRTMTRLPTDPPRLRPCINSSFHGLNAQRVILIYKSSQLDNIDVRTPPPTTPNSRPPNARRKSTILSGGGGNRRRVPISE